ncbi:MAG: hypothetical protein AAF485_14575 [Chloroflexota bacterium]
MTNLIENPYVGPRTFSEEEADLFFGRDREARDLLALILSERLVLFYAQSGAGKSSLINTRLIPTLRDKEGFEVLPVGRVSGELPPGIAPTAVRNIFTFNLILSLNQAETEEGLDSLRQFTETSLADFLQGDDDPSPEATQDEAEYTYEIVPHVLVIDQFEEIITTNLARWPERIGFFEQLSEVMSRHPNLWIVLTMREDFVTALDPYLQYLPNRLRARFYMQRMGYRSALEAIQEPARLGGRPFTVDAAQALADNLRRIRTNQTMEISQADTITPGTLKRTEEGLGTPSLGQFIEPVQLQAVCYQLWENLKEHPGETITEQDIQESGDVDTALAEFYEQALSQTTMQTKSTELTLRDWFENQVITEAGTRGTVYRGKAKTAGLSNSAVILLADQFLLRAEIRAGGTWYELVHDRFVEPILQSNQVWREQRLQQHPLMQATHVWQDSGQSTEKLLSERQIKAAQLYAEANPLDITEDEQEFLTQSIRQADLEKELARQAIRRRNITIAIALAVIVVLVGLTASAFQQANRAIRAEEDAQIKANAAATAESKAQDSAEIAQQNADTAATAEIKAQEEADAASLAEGRAIERANAAATAEYQSAQSEAEAQRQAGVAQTAQAVAVDEQAKAEAAGTAVAQQLNTIQQLEGSEAELSFPNITQPEGRLASLAKLALLGRTGLVAKLFWELPSQNEKLAILRVKDPQQVSVIDVLSLNLADVNQTDNSTPFLAAMIDGLSDLPEETDQSRALKAQLEQWVEARRQVSLRQYEAALAQYDQLIAQTEINPALYYERAAVQIQLDAYDATLVDLEQMMTLVNSTPSFAESDLVARNSRFATTDQAIEAAGQLLYLVRPDLGDHFDENQLLYPQLAEVRPKLVLEAADGPPYLLLYTKWDGIYHNLYIANTDGDDERLLLTRAAGPAWSTDGNFIFFYGEPGVEDQIRDGVTHRIDVGNGIIRLTADPLPTNIDQVRVFQGGNWNAGSARSASIPPNREVVAYEDKPGGGDFRIFFINGQDNQLYPYQLQGEQVEWSPDGEHIVYRSGRDGKSGIWVSHWTDTGHRNVTNNGSDSFPTWSPDGNKIAFSRNEGGNIDIYTVNADGTNLQRLTSASGPDTLPVYTPNGDLVFRSARSGSWGIWIMRGNGQEQIQIIPDAGLADDWAYSKMDTKER